MPELRLLSWIVGGLLRALFAWTGLSLLIASLPVKIIDTTRPGQKAIGYVLLGGVWRDRFPSPERAYAVGMGWTQGHSFAGYSPVTSPPVVSETH